MDARHAAAAALALAGGSLAVLVGTRRWHQHWGATDEEIARPLPGDDLIPDPKLDSTQAITIHAPAERIWPWLAQAGYGGRAGFYSYDALERRFGARNTDRLNPALPALTTGDTVPFYPGMPMTVAVADPPHTLVLWLVTTANKAIDPTGPWPEEHVAWSWAFILDPVDANTTRLLTRMRVTYRPTARWGPYVHLLLEPGHFVMGRRQLLGLRQRAQATGRPAWPGRNRVKRSREVARSAADVLVACPRFVTAPLYRRWHLRWGATDTEVISVMPGDELVPHPSFTATRAITISASPKDVWPWIVQIGTGRAGFYSYDLFDNAARPSAERILPQLQDIRVGDWVPMSTKVNKTTAFKVKAFEPTQWLLWVKPHSTWSWRLTPTEDGGTRLVTRLKEKYDRRSPGLALLTIILFEFGDFPMMRKLLLRMKSRAEGPPHIAPSQRPKHADHPPAGRHHLPTRRPTQEHVLQYEFQEPFILDSTKIATKLEVHATPLDQPLADTVASYRTNTTLDRLATAPGRTGRLPKSAPLATQRRRSTP
jgi:hypothetical protein